MTQSWSGDHDVGHDVSLLLSLLGLDLCCYPVQIPLALAGDATSAVTFLLNDLDAFQSLQNLTGHGGGAAVEMAGARSTAHTSWVGRETI